MSQPLSLQADLSIDDDEGRLFTVTSRDNHLIVSIDAQVSISRMVTVIKTVRLWSQQISSGMSATSLDIDIHYRQQLIAQAGAAQSESWLSNMFKLPAFRICWGGLFKSIFRS